MNGLINIYKKELRGYFLTPLGFVIISVFLFTTGTFTFYLGGFYERGRADLEPFFAWHPWIYLFLMPAVSMRLWAEERKAGTIELLMTLPVSVNVLVAGKFLAAWTFTGICLLLTGTIWLTVSYLGDPDHGVIIASYLGSFLMAGAYLSIGSCISALTRNQVTAFVLTVVICMLFTLSGFPLVSSFYQSLLPQPLADLVASFSFLTNFQEISLGILELKSFIYFVSLIMFSLFVNKLILNVKRL